MTTATLPASQSAQQVALSYAAMGWAVLPLRASGKEPLTQHGVYDASSDPEQIVEWWCRYPAANIAIATGQASGTCALDIDGAISIELEYSPEPSKITEWVAEAYTATDKLMRQVGLRS